MLTRYYIVTLLYPSKRITGKELQDNENHKLFASPCPKKQEQRRQNAHNTLTQYTESLAGLK